MTIRTILKVATVLLALAGCADDGQSIHDTHADDVLEVAVQPLETRGTFEHNGQTVSFSTVMNGPAVESTIELRGLVLMVTVNTETGVVETDGYAADSGDDTQLLAEDLAVLHRLEMSLAASQADAEANPSLDQLNRALTLWSAVTPAFPLKHTYHGRFDRSASLCGYVNTPGQGVHTKKYIAATHNCQHDGRWQDSTTADAIFMSMHPSGSCGGDTYFGTSTGNYRCYEPDHDSNVEYGYGDCFGRCGGGCGSATQFTAACLNHDLCVRFGHSIASAFCADELSATGVDVVFARHCGGHLKIDYNWAGKSQEGQCPQSWNGTNDGCDHGCQFIDGDCFR